MIGTDPEFFIVDAESKLVPSYSLIEYTKDKPYNHDGYKIHNDNVSIEGSIPPASNKTEFIANISTVKSMIRDMIPDRYNIICKPSIQLDEDILQQEEAKEFYCSEDEDGYEFFKPKKIHKLDKRFAGGHVHMTLEKLGPAYIQNAVELCDIFIGAPSSLLDFDNDRMVFFARPGMHRVKEYGIEYRYPSNYWLKSEEYQNFIYDQVEIVQDLYDKIEPIDRIDMNKLVQFMQYANREQIKDTLSYIIGKYFTSHKECFARVNITL